MASGLVRVLPRAFRLLTKRCAATATAATVPKTQAPGDKVSEELRLTFAAPDKAFFANDLVKQVDVPTMGGMVGLLAKHVPILGVLKPGIVTVTGLDGKVTKKFVSSGTLAMNPDGTCQLLAEEAINIDEIDEVAVRQQLDSASRRIQDVKDEVSKAEVTIEVEICEALLKALSGQT